MSSTNFSYKDISSSIKPGTKVLFATFPADGHFNPLTGLAVHLKNLGCDVRWYTSSTYADKLQKLDIPHYPLQKAVDITGDKIEELVPEREKHKSQIAKLNFDFIHLFILRGPEYFEDIQAIHETFPFELMVADMAFAAIPLVKEKMNIPVATIGIVPLAETSKDLPPCGLGMTPTYSFWGKKKQNMLRFIADKILFRKSYSVLKKVLGEYGIEPNGNLFDTLIRKSSIVLQSGTPGFEYFRSDIGSNIRFVGPMLPYSKEKSRQVWTHPKLKQYDKIVLVTQGTVEKDVEKLLVPTLEAFKNSSYLVVVTTGGSQTAELRQRYPQINYIIEDFIPFADIMPYADVYISNGGYGGVLLGIENKLPMVVAGVHEGKNEICARVGYFDIGINLKTEKPTPEQIRKSVESIVNNIVYKKNVTALCKEFSTYDTNDLCTEFIGQLLNQNVSALKYLIEEPAAALLEEA